MPKVTPFEGLTRFHVAGNEEQVYLVDLAAWFGSGLCGCAHFEYRLQPLLKFGKEKALEAIGEPNGIWPNAKLQCKHIQSAYAHLGHELAVELVTKISKQKKSPEES